MSGKCSKRIYAGSYTGHPCPYPGKIKVDGEWYCGVHDPIKREAKLAAIDAAHESARTVRLKAETARKREEAEQARKLALWPEIIEALEAIVSDIAGGPERTLPNEIACDSGLADQAVFARALLAKMRGPQ